MSQLYYMMTIPGLETLAFSELRTHIPAAEQVKFARGIALFRSTAPPEELLTLRTVEDAFVALAHIKSLGPGQDALRVLHSATLNSNITNALHLWRRARGGSHARTWRVVSQKSGAHEFRRVDAGQAVKDALRKIMPTKMRLVDDDADVEIWLGLHGSLALVGLRLSDATMRHRKYKREHLPASLRPTVAASMSWITQPSPQDMVLDPLCGAGTILIERGLLAPCERLLGGDIRAEAVRMAQVNLRAARVAADTQVWDACALPLDAASVTHLVTNLPFGKQISTGENLQRLYNAFGKEFTRVLAPTGQLVTLTSEDQLWYSILRDNGWRVTKKLVLVLLGQPASIFVCART